MSDSLPINCPCGSGDLYTDCCEVFHNKTDFAKNPEVLMRSRYSAFALGNAAYIKETMQLPILALFNEDNFAKRAEEWLRLEVLNAYWDPKNPDIGYVEFKAYYQIKGEKAFIHELSQFKQIDLRWYYVDGKHFE